MTSGAGGQNVELLLVEDHPSDVAQILNTLRKANLCNRVHVLREGAQALDFLFRTGSLANLMTPPSEILVFLSLNLQDVSALEILKRIKGDERTRSIPIILLTSSQEERGVMQGYKLGASACIVKPLDISRLVEAVAEVRFCWLLISPDEGGGNS